MLITTTIFLVILSVLVLVHEFGHFLAAKKTGVKIEEFGFGYPPRLWAKKIGETEYSINAIPFGGFVRLFGDPTEGKPIKGKNLKKSFMGKSKKARMGVILAGVLANFLLGIFVFSIVYSLAGIPKKTDKIKIVGIAPGSPAQKAGLEEGDVVLAVDEKKLTELTEFTKLIQEKKGKEIKLLVSREGGNLLFWLTPRENPPEGEGPLGVVVSDVEIVKYPFWQMPLRGAVEGTKEAFSWGMLVATSIKKMFLDLIFQGILPQDVAGPVGIFQATGMVAKTGILNILQFLGILSVNLAVLNILPFPALDGGRLIFVAYELVFRRKPKPKFERWVNTAGFAFLIFLLILVTINDIKRIFQTTDFLSRLRSILPF